MRSPDGVHDVDEIRKLRDGGTRAMPEGDVSKALKDRICPFCGKNCKPGKLGPHLDRFVNPKKGRKLKSPDGVHDVEEIRKLRTGPNRDWRSATFQNLVEERLPTPVSNPNETAPMAASPRGRP
ncbi:hypothetical protein CLAFUW4_13403 [Fulvia fulva]|uniref:Uncharacterized protein n=1 Tax=Passalora fulva TaxID=5499 RepID=A0A9Q8PKE3_PASFU|nr:uncharacterized protein CLAFUR5_13256 [Fulvia fulva]KAK4611744.1 hypothetical protein CLAFUR4_13406 [Fulvia fulva]KAK4612746.1 hypothetical protein CLAFUR0_13413 [Fulvia fulva]UJO24050.1 hypothetical protein CLAFUR5_13256 [Fulvia fulva]WPV21666.1 hypothetical protein CLAFUW4_13403 [Fulvia fulva]WPV36301.1 hypothetical protein CLAFUW7_13410 [Fulvia fulva]